MGRRPRSVALELIQHSKSRRVTFEKRRAGLEKKAHELSILCDLKISMIIYGPKVNDDAPTEPTIWPQDADMVRSVINFYKNSPKDGARKKNSDISRFYEEKARYVEFEVAKLLKKKTEAKYLASDEHNYDALSAAELMQYGNQIETKLQEINYRIESLKSNQEAYTVLKGGFLTSSFSHSNPCYPGSDEEINTRIEFLKSTQDPDTESKRGFLASSFSHSNPCYVGPQEINTRIESLERTDQEPYTESKSGFLTSSFSHLNPCYAKPDQETNTRIEFLKSTQEAYPESKSEFLTSSFSHSNPWYGEPSMFNLTEAQPIQENNAYTAQNLYNRSNMEMELYQPQYISSYNPFTADATFNNSVNALTDEEMMMIMMMMNDGGSFNDNLMPSANYNSRINNYDYYAPGLVENAAGFNNVLEPPLCSCSIPEMHNSHGNVPPYTTTKPYPLLLDQAPQMHAGDQIWEKKGPM